MRRCPRCTSLVDEGACPTCGHRPLSLAAAAAEPAGAPPLLARKVSGSDVAFPTAVLAARGSYLPAGRRPTGVAALAILGMAYGGWLVVASGIALAVGLAELRKFEEAASVSLHDARSLFVVLALLAAVFGLAIILLNAAFYRGAGWAWFVVLAVNVLEAADCLASLAASPALPEVFQPFKAKIAGLSLVGLLFYSGLVAYLLSPPVRAYVFGGPRRVAV